MSIAQLSGRFTMRHFLATLVATGAFLVSGTLAQAQGVPGVDFYLGAGIGTGDVAINHPEAAIGQFKEDHTAFKVFGGLRAAPLFGVELEYLNFGKPRGDAGTDTDAQGKLTGVAAFGLFYVPLPLPVIDIYAKAGLARLDRKLSDLTLDDFSTKGTEFAYGGGLQLKFGSFAIRAEYERFNADGKDPTLLSLNFAKFFL